MTFKFKDVKIRSWFITEEGVFIKTGDVYAYDVYEFTEPDVHVFNVFHPDDLVELVDVKEVLFETTSDLEEDCYEQEQHSSLTAKEVVSRFLDSL